MGCRKWLVDYEYDGAKYTIAVPAESRDEAVERKSAIARGTVIGELMMEIPAGPGAGWLIRAVCAVRNWVYGK